MEERQIMELAKELHLPAEVRGGMAAAMESMPWEQLEEIILHLTDPVLAEEAQIRLGALLTTAYERQTGMGQLAVMLAAAYHARKRYEQIGIPDGIFLDTMGCFRRFLTETKKNTGVWQFDRAFWTWRQTSLSLFRLGTLEFEYRSAGEADRPESLGKDDMVLGVHIPSDAQLTEEKLADSYGKMEYFYRTYGDKLCMAGKPTAVLCGSWLLSPRLRELLPEDSGIRRFAADYELFTDDSASEDFYQWLFGGKRRLSELPEETSLQKAVKKYLRGGGNIGSAAGIFRKGLRL